MSPVDDKKQKPTYWRSLAEYDDSPEFRRFVEHEFAEPIAELPPNSPERRRFMQLMGASFALAGASTGCRWQEDKLLPHSRRPEGHVPGEPKHFATIMDLGGVATGLLAKSYDGRPIKIEGNPQHPGSRGAAGVLHQASVLELYDPDRSQGVARYQGGARTASSWEDFEKFAAEHLAGVRQRGGAGLAVLSEASSSLSLDDMAKRLKSVFPQARWYDYEPIDEDNRRQGTAMALGSPYRPLLALDQAKIIVALDADLFGAAADALPLSADFAKSREPESGSMSRLYVIESAFSMTGGVADHRLPLRAELIKPLAAALDADLSAKLNPSPALGPAQPRPEAPFLADAKVSAFVEALAAELLAHRGQSVIAVGATQPPEVHAIAARLNALLGNVGSTIGYVPDRGSSRSEPGVQGSVAGIKALAADMSGGKVQTLIILGGNPVYNAPADLAFAEALGKVETSIRLGLFEDETSRACSWHLPAAHYLEAWGDGRAYDGTVSIAQPLIAPLYGGRSAIEVAALLIGDSTKDGKGIVRRTLNRYLGNDERVWRRAVHDGLLQRSALSRVQPGLKPLPPYPMSERNLAGLEVGNGQLEVVFAQDAKLYDGRYANNGWLQELPDPMTKLTWDNALTMSPATAKALGVEDEELATLEVGGKSVTLPVLITPGQAAGSVRVALGYGRTAAGVIGIGGYLEHGLTEDVKGLKEAEKLLPVGVNVYPLRTTELYHFGGGASVKGTGKRYKLANFSDLISP